MSSKVTKRPVKPGKKQAPVEDAAPAPDAAVLLQLERIRHHEEELDKQARLYQELLGENARLEQQQEEEARDNYVAMGFFREELILKNQELEALQGEVETLGGKVQAAHAEAVAREQQQQAAFEQSQAALQGQVVALQQQLDSLAEFQQRRASLEAETQSLREECQQLRLDHHNKVTALQRKLSLANQRGGAQGKAEEEAGNFAGDVHQVLQHNKKITRQMKTYAEEAEELQLGMKALEAQRAQLLRDVKLKDEMEQHYALRGTLQAREIKDAASKISTLEKGMAQLASAFEQEKAMLVQELRTHQAEAIAEQSMLRRLLKLRTKELNHVRNLAHQVLRQRSDVEAFLLSSIQQVRMEMARSAVSGEGSMLQLEDAMAASSKVDIRELTWEDRERVLRQLFVRINNQRRKAAPEAPAQPLPGPFTEAGPAGLA